MNYVQDWSKYAPYFTRNELACKHTGQCEMTEETMDALLKVRIEYGKPMRITSGYRSTKHPNEANKAFPGEHTHGECVDVGVYGENAVQLMNIAMKHGFTRIGVSQKGDMNARFLHLGRSRSYPNPTVWSY
ncbi:MAG: peptidase M15 [Anaerolineae bacterium]|nr:peptidase M15 [Anaerolineae bacterium]